MAHTGKLGRHQAVAKKPVVEPILKVRDPVIDKAPASVKIKPNAEETTTSSTSVTGDDPAQSARLPPAACRLDDESEDSSSDASVESLLEMERRKEYDARSMTWSLKNFMPNNGSASPSLKSTVTVATSGSGGKGKHHNNGKRDRNHTASTSSSKPHTIPVVPPISSADDHPHTTRSVLLHAISERTISEYSSCVKPQLSSSTVMTSDAAEGSLSWKLTRKFMPKLRDLICRCAPEDVHNY